jgi:putative intracellular protease/amidase
MGTALTSAPVAFLVAAEGAEQSELQQPWEAVIKEGGRPVLVSPSRDKIQMFEHLDRGDTMPVDVQVADARAQDYAAWCCPGEWRTLTSCAPTRRLSPSPGASSTPASQSPRSATRRGH